ncbi:MAG: methyl-accepting chemotaxis protein [Spirochaetes bacterium]|nr:methyl-accepting chemotaxis protein [Spirochaetota bacterium]
MEVSKMELSKQERRKQYLIHKKFQVHFIIDFLKIVISFVFITGLVSIIYYYFRYQYGESIFESYLLIVKKGETIKYTNHFEIIVPIILISMFTISLFMIVYGVFYSHRIAGPIYRLKKTLDAIASGHLNFMVRLRKKDKFKEMAEHMNNLIYFLNGRIKEIQTSNALLQNKINSLKNELNKKSLNKKQVLNIYQEIQKLASDIKKSVKDFKTK